MALAIAARVRPCRNTGQHFLVSRPFLGASSTTGWSPIRPSPPTKAPGHQSHGGRHAITSLLRYDLDVIERAAAAVDGGHLNRLGGGSGH